MLYEEAGVSNFTAIYPSNGTVAWTVNTTSFVNVSWHGSLANWAYRLLWSSPLIYNHNAYVGLASACDGTVAQGTGYEMLPGQLLKIPLTGSHTPTVWFDVTHGINQNDTGGSIWSSPAVDAKTNTIWITTGNENVNATKSYLYARSMIALNATTLRPIATRQFGGLGLDEDFGAGPTLYYNSTGAPWVVATNKDGKAHSFNRNNTTGPGTSWNRVLSNPDQFSISPGAFDGNSLYFVAGQFFCGSRNGFNGTADRLSPTGGSILGSNCTSPQPTLRGPNGTSGAAGIAGTTAANGLVIDAVNGIRVTSDAHSPPPTYTAHYPTYNAELDVRNSSNLHLLYSYPLIRPVAGEPIVSDGQIFVPLGNWTPVNGAQPTGRIDAFSLPLTATAVLTRVLPSNRWLVGGYATVSGGMPGYTCEWYWGNGGSSVGCGTPSSPESVTYSSSLITSYTGNLTVIDYRGSKVVVPFTVAVGYHVGGGGLTAYSLVENCRPAVIYGTWPANGGCAGAFASSLYVAGYSALTGGISPYAYSWLFGDATGPVTSQMANHNYTTGGTYMISMTGTDSALPPDQSIAAVWITV
jgi:hypothetical protein